MHLLTRIFALSLAATTLPAAALFAQAAAPTPPVADVVVNMHDIDIADVAQQISRITGRTLILDPSVKGTVNVTSAEPLSVNGVWDLFQSVLRVNGFAAVRSGRAWRIVPQAAAVRDGGSQVARGRVGGQQVVTRMIRLRNLPSETAARVFRPLVASFGSVEPLTQPNAIAVTDYAENVARIEQLAASLDGGGGNGFDSIRLQYAAAKDVGNAIRSILGDGTNGQGPRVAVDERSNIVIVRGEESALAEARRMAAVLDRPGSATPVTRLFRLSNNDAESITDVLRGLMGDGSAQGSNPIARSLSAGGSSGIGAGTVGTGSLGSSGGSGYGVPGLAATLGVGNSAATSPMTTTIGSSTQGSTSGGSSGGFSTPELAIEPAPELNAIVVRGTPAAIASIEPLIRELDVRRPQVMIEAAIVEITGDRAEQLGIQLGIGPAAAANSNGAATSFTNLGLSLRSILSVLGAPAAIGLLPDGLSANVGSRNDFSILVQALGQSTNANLLSTPSLTTLDNQPAEIVVGQNVPFRTGSFTTSGNTTDPFTTIQRQDVGITLRVVPRIHDGNVIRLEVSQEVSSLVGSVTGAADLITNRRAIQTTVLADDGQTIVLGGLISDDRTSVKSQVPVLGDIPVLGELFKSRTVSQTRRTLFVFLKPTTCATRPRSPPRRATNTRASAMAKRRCKPAAVCS